MRWKVFCERAVLLPLLLPATGCAVLGEQVGSSAAIVRTSMVPASVPYYLNLCGQEPDHSYRLFAPSALGSWSSAKDVTDAAAKARAVERRSDCMTKRRIDNGDPITVRLHRVGIGGLATYNAVGKCTKGCKRDIAIVLDFNGSQSLQKPIVAFYQTNVTPDSNLQFVNQIIYSQNEWFFRYPPSVRIRLYDVRDDKDNALRANLETVKKGATFIRSYIAGAAIAGPIVDTAVQAADQLISGPRNRPIMDMAFQLFPDEQEDAVKKPVPTGTQPPPATFSSNPLTVAEIKAAQKRAIMSAREQDGKLGPKTLAALKAVAPDLPDEKTLPEFNQGVRRLIVGQGRVEATELPDATFGSPIYASQFIVFNESADPGGKCRPATPRAKYADRSRMGEKLPDFYFAPDGVNYGGARVYYNGATMKCVMETSFVTFAITRETANVAADIAKRISDLQTKFAAGQAVSEDAVASLTSARVDAELALAIDRVENTRRIDQLRAMIDKLGALIADAKATGPTDRAVPPMPNGLFRTRAYRLIEAYIGCPANDQMTAVQFTELAGALGTARWQAVTRQASGSKPYFAAEKSELRLTCETAERPGDGKKDKPSKPDPAETAPAAASTESQTPDPNPAADSVGP